MSTSMELEPCPICFEIPTSVVQYASTSNHSWSNSSSRCDGHGICWSCLQKYIEIQVLSEGKSNIRCPGVSCRYHMLQEDIEKAMWGATAAERVLSVWKQLRDESCQDRLWDAISADTQDIDARWVLQHSQPCPTCFTLARRERGCNHVVCRCGTAFCFGCGAPCDDGCICCMLDDNSRDGEVYFAAWLRSAEGSPEICHWLWEEIWSPSGDTDTMDLTLAVWLWAAGVAGNLRLVSSGVPPTSHPRHAALIPLQWQRTYDDGDWCIGDDSCPSDIEDDQEVCGHLRKEIFSLESRRMQQRKVRRVRGDTTHWSQNPAGSLMKVPSASAQNDPARPLKTRSRRIGRSNFCADSSCAL